jgi:hypothetical protein
VTHENIKACRWKTGALGAQTSRARVQKLVLQLEGNLEDIKEYVHEIVRPDTCVMINSQSSSLPASRSGGLRGASIDKARR